MIIYGLIVGLILGLNKIISSSLMSAESDLSNFDNLESAVLFIVLSGFIFFGIKNYRDKVKDGRMSYGQVFIHGLLITVISAFIYSFVWTIYLSFADTNNLYDIHVHMLLREMTEEGATNDEIEVSVDMMENLRVYFRYPAFRFFVSFLTGPIGPGIIVSLLLGLALKSKGDTSIQHSTSEQL